jgi:fumarate reductase iron-sulfur subunit
MPTNITLEFRRYRPEAQTEPIFQSYETPFRKDWAILDALNYSSDNLDGSLSYRCFRRTGVCGS